MSGAPEEEEGRFLQWGREDNNNEAALVWRQKDARRTSRLRWLDGKKEPSED